MKAIEERTRKVREEEQVWDLKILLKYIQERFVERKELNIVRQMSISIILVMIYTNLRLAEIMRAKINWQDDNQQTIIIETFIKKKPAGRVKLTLNMMEKQDLCPVKWFRLWMVGKTQYEEGEIWKRKGIQQNFKAEQWSKKIREEMVKAGISKKERVTSIRAASITRAFQLGASSEQINRWTRHANTASTVQQYYDRANNDMIRQQLIL
ncbi:MAG: hypothetical protein EZS28_014711 [Streblomastix strix]|uniref:Tyr recombinase domain-containing protein n=1 Tax=Streblomastix strix TaxID=222440 RepID=A0A5J4W4F1_9EUKA|nr:MAG: hypothetical protein EZS28_014711 [Streblomastix strix]